MTKEVTVEFLEQNTIIEDSLDKMINKEEEIKKQHPEKKFVVVRKYISLIIPYTTKTT